LLPESQKQGGRGDDHRLVEKGRGGERRREGRKTCEKNGIRAKGEKDEGVKERESADFHVRKKSYLSGLSQKEEQKKRRDPYSLI